MAWRCFISASEARYICIRLRVSKSKSSNSPKPLRRPSQPRVARSEPGRASSILLPRINNLRAILSQNRGNIPKIPVPLLKTGGATGRRRRSSPGPWRRPRPDPPGTDRKRARPSIPGSSSTVAAPVHGRANGNPGTGIGQDLLGARWIVPRRQALKTTTAKLPALENPAPRDYTDSSLRRAPPACQCVALRS